MSNNGPQTTEISNDPTGRLAVEWLAFRWTPGKCAVSLVHPGNAQERRVRIVNMSPQTALNLLTWLEHERPRLEREAQREQERQMHTEITRIERLDN